MQIDKSRWCRILLWGCVLLAVTAMFFSSACGNARKQTESDLVSFIMRYEREMVPVVEAINRTRWRFFETGSLRYLSTLDSLYGKRIELLHDAKSFAYLKKTREKGEIKDAYLRRQVDILYKEYLPCQASVGLQKRIIRLDTYLHLETWNRLRKEEPNRIDVQGTSPADVRFLQKNWEEWKKGGAAVADSLLQLVRLRNRMAREAGYADYFSMYLDLNEIRQSFMDSLVAELTQATDTVYRRQKEEKDRCLSARFSIPVSRLRPWHYSGALLRYGQYPNNHRKDGYYSYINIPSVADRFYSGIGFDIEDILARSNFLYWSEKIPAFECIVAGNTNDIRIVGTISGTENDMHRLMGATGKAIYLKYIPGTLPYLLRRPASEALYCGVSAFFARMTQYPGWILSMGILSVGQAGGIRGSTNEAFLHDQRLGCRWRLLLYAFEKQLYADPEQDLDALWYTMVGEYLQTDIRPPLENPWRADWAAEPYFALYPCEVSNHLLGEMWAAQVVDYLCSGDCRLNDRCDFNIVGNKSVGRFFERDIFASGAALNWEKLTETAMGKPLSIHAFVEQFK